MKQRLVPKRPVVVPRSAVPQASSWVPPEQRTSAWYLFHELFLCRVQRIQTLSLEEMREFGTPTSGDPEFDKQMRNERVDRMLPICSSSGSSMLDYWEQGVTVGIANEKDTKTIYEYISNHLEAWKTHLSVEINVRGAPLEDLVKLDKFANVVHKHARYHFTQEYVDSIMGRQIEAIPHAVQNVLRPYEEVIRIGQPTVQPTADEAQKQLEEQYPNRVSLSDAFQRGVRAGGVKPVSSWRR